MCYVGYLVHVGLLMVVLPWSRLWTWVLFRLPTAVVPYVDAPWARGAISAFGVLHLALVVAEITLPRSADRPPPDPAHP
jgi:hypothetical protein